ncbi:Uncharacterised protein [Bordetella pertussis]|nr:Uncharacterised protein [Bordetella pertussis]
MTAASSALGVRGFMNAAFGLRAVAVLEGVAIMRRSFSGLLEK